MPELKVKELHIGHWQGDDGSLTYSTIALSVEGKVYRYKPSLDGWIPLGMEIHDSLKSDLEEDSDHHGGFGGY